MRLSHVQPLLYRKKLRNPCFMQTKTIHTTLYIHNPSGCGLDSWVISWAQSGSGDDCFGSATKFNSKDHQYYRDKHTARTRLLAIHHRAENYYSSNDHCLRPHITQAAKTCGADSKIASLPLPEHRRIGNLQNFASPDITRV